MNINIKNIITLGFKNVQLRNSTFDKIISFFGIHDEVSLQTEIHNVEPQPPTSNSQ
jgi:hypothetical protein